MPSLFCMTMNESTDLLLPFCLAMDASSKRMQSSFACCYWYGTYHTAELPQALQFIFFHNLKMPNVIVEVGQGLFFFPTAKRMYWSQQMFEY